MRLYDILGNMSDVTNILSKISNGDSQAADELLPAVYEGLRRLAQQKMSQESAGQTLQATALVHEAYLRLVKSPGNEWNSRGHFYGAAAEAMRRILVENARRKKQAKRGGNLQRLPLDTVDLVEDHRVEEIVSVSEALDLLALENQQAADLVKLKYFAGLTLTEAANCLGIPDRTADRIWAYAKAWLHRKLQS